MAKRICTITDCERPVVGWGWCRLHYGRWRATGSVRPGEPPIKRFETVEEYFYAHVEKTQHCWNWTGQINAAGYGLASYRLIGRSIRAHRLAYRLLVGDIPDGRVIDHRCHNRCCVNPDHLRPVTDKQNKENRYGAARHNISGVRGVAWHKAAGKWSARVGHNGKQYHVGLFANIADAEAAVIAKRNELFTCNDRDRTLI